MVLCVLFFAGCSDKPNEDGGSVGEHKNLPNIAVTEANLLEFLDSFYVAVGGQGLSFAQEKRGLREKRAKETVKIDTTIQGSVSGKAHMSGTLSNDLTSMDFSSKSTFFDYSNGGDLFVGGSTTSTATVKQNSGYVESKTNGTIDFRGHFSGSIVFKNFYYKVDIVYGEEIITGSAVIKSGGEEIDFSGYIF